MALAIIEFSIGSEFVLQDMLKLGKSIVVITLLEVIGAIAVVFSVMYFGLKQPFAFSIVIGLYVSSNGTRGYTFSHPQYRAQGPLDQDDFAR